MTRYAKGAAILAVIIALAGCSGTISTGGGGGKKTPIKTWPTAAPLTGSIPVGYWWCVEEDEFENLRTSNTSRYKPYVSDCRSGHSTAHQSNAEPVEIRPDGTGYDLDVYAVDDSGIPDGAFRVTGSDALYHRSDSLRWQLLEGGAKLHYQTTRNYVHAIEVLSDDVIRYRVSFRPDLMIRVGSSAYKSMLAFRECVSNNAGKKLFEVTDCGDPLPGVDAGLVADWSAPRQQRE